MVSESLKVCVDCRVPLPVSEFHPHRTTRDRLFPKCKTCHKAENAAWKRANPERVAVYRQKWPTTREQRMASYMRRYGITVEKYEELHAAQRGLCVICGQPETKLDRRGLVQRLSVDHDHSSGRVRGLLCSSCNFGLGAFKDEPERLARAIDYLNQSKDVRGDE